MLGNGRLRQWQHPDNVPAMTTVRACQFPHNGEARRVAKRAQAHRQKIVGIGNTHIHRLSSIDDQHNEIMAIAMRQANDCLAIPPYS